MEDCIEKDPFILNVDHSTAQLLKFFYYGDEQVKKKPRKCPLLSFTLALGIILFLLGFLCFAISQHVEEAFLHLVQTYTALIPGGKFFGKRNYTHTFFRSNV